MAVSGYTAAMASVSLLYEFKFESILSDLFLQKSEFILHKQKVDSWCGRFRELEGSK